MAAPARTPPPSLTTLPLPSGPARSRRIEDWRPEDPGFWAATGRRVARRNLVLSVLSGHVGFSIWGLWSVLVLFLPESVYGIDPAGKFLLTTLPTALGAFVLLPWTSAVARFGGRTWTVVSAALLLVPTVATALVLEPGVDHGTLLLVSCLAGVGGGTFAGSLATIDAFSPDRLESRALGLGAVGGGLGVPAVQLVGLLVLATAGAEHPRVVLWVYIPLIVVVAAGAALLMDDLVPARDRPPALRQAVREPHTYVVSFLCIGTLGSSVGFGFAFGQVLQNQFADDVATPLAAASLTWLGPLLGSLVHPLGGALAARFGGARTTLLTFAAMAAGAAVVLIAGRVGSPALFVVGFLLLFVLSGIGNGSTWAMVPAVLRSPARQAVDGGGDPEAAGGRAPRPSGALVGVAGAVGAFGGVLVNLALRQSFLTTGSGDAAYLGFIAFYAACVVVTWAVHLRPRAAHRG
ncbi:MFS transporter [Geodermatophilus sp. SYSU D00815]